MNRPFSSLLFSLILLVFYQNCVGNNPPLAPSNLRVCDLLAPVGVDETLYFGWYVEDKDDDEIQTAYQIQVASSPTLLNEQKADIWDSGKVKSSKQNHIQYEGQPLLSDHRYYWTVKTWDKDGQEGTFAPYCQFHVGLLSNQDWKDADWIKRDNSDPDDYSYFRKMQQLPAKEIFRATTYITSVHKYECYINGHLVGTGPAYQHPQYQYYNAFDTTSFLKTGESNCFAIFNHWFGGGQGRPESAKGVLMKTIIHFSDGTSSVICTDGSWKQTRASSWVLGQKSRNPGEGVGYVEHIDARLLIPEWNQPSFDDSQWKSVAVIGTHPTTPWTGNLTADLTRIDTYRIKPKAIRKPAPNTTIIDLGKVYAGVPVISFEGGTSGALVEMKGGYGLNKDGTIDDRQNQRTDLSYRAILNGDTFVFKPCEYVGMRYLEITNAPMPITTDNVAFEVRHTRMDLNASQFQSSNPTLNAVWNLMKHSLRTCMQEEFVDTPTREKGGFLFDSIAQSMVAMPVLNDRKLTQRTQSEFLKSMEQHWNSKENRGRMNAVYPNNDGARDIPDFTQNFLLWAWNYYLETGDVYFLETNWEQLNAIGEYVYRHSDSKTDLITKLTGGRGPYQYGIIDWPWTMRFAHDMKCDSRTVINGLAIVDFQILEKIAVVLGKKEAASVWGSRSNKLTAAFNQHFLNKEGLYVDGLYADDSQSSQTSQRSNAIALALSIQPASKTQSILDLVKPQKMSVGMVTAPWLLRALGKTQQGEQLMELLTNENWNGWANLLKKGATSTWESWDADETGESQSHAWGASGLEAYTRYILGIRPILPQYEEVLIQPLDFGTKLTYAKGMITTDRGPIHVEWKRSADSYELKLAIPTNVTANISIPAPLSPENRLNLDGKIVPAIREGNFLNLRSIGSGTHTITTVSSSE